MYNVDNNIELLIRVEALEIGKLNKDDPAVSAKRWTTARTFTISGDGSGSVSMTGAEDMTLTLTIANDSHSHSNSTITSLDASKITSGIISLDRLPQGAIEKCVVVANDTARFALTTAQVQTGDTVKVESTQKMYFVIDQTKLNSEAGYTVYTAGSATSVPWSGVTGKPATFTPSTHNHNDLYYGKDEINNKLNTKLNISGGTMTGALVVNSTITASGVIKGSDVTSSSDMRFKTGVRKIENPMDIINRLNGYTFYKNNESKRTTGISAQEALEVFDEVVFKDPNGYLSVAYGNMAGLFIEAIKEISQENKDLKMRVAELEKNVGVKKENIFRRFFNLIKEVRL